MIRALIVAALFASTPALADSSLELVSLATPTGFVLTVTGAQPGETVTFMRSAALTEEMCGAPSVGVCRGLATPVAIMSSVTADAGGRAVVNGVIDEVIDLNHLMVQATVLGTDSETAPLVIDMTPVALPAPVVVAKL
jgi:hypothetical protein